ncbi:MAG TPA: cobalamin-binding protein [Dongiaceae bacterium]|nr:cobalamin-binding protein [Dongiaceae bacterium]
MAKQRIVSLLPSATEILFALGLGEQVVGVSHECDFPAAAREKQVVIHSRIPKDATPLEIDRLVREFSARGESVYSVDGEVLRSLAPDLIVTQDLCHVCAASPEDLSAILADFAERPEVLCLNPLDLRDVWRDILWVGEATLRGHEAEKLLEGIGRSLAAIERHVACAEDCPRVAFLEWLQPAYVGGHWVPEMIEIAGARDVFGKAGTPSFRVTPEEIVEAQPEVLLVAPCGYSAQQARDEYRSLELPEAWATIPAVQNGQVFALEANSYFSRPGPRLVTGLEILAKVLNPGAEVSREAEAAILPIAESHAETRGLARSAGH